MRPNQAVTFEFLEERRVSQRYHEDPVLLFVLEGSLGVTTDQQAYALSAEDFLLINANRAYGYATQGKLLAVRFHISMARLSDALHQSPVLFWCCSACTNENPDSYQEVRRLLKSIIFYSINGARDEFYLNSLGYQLLSLLCNSYLLSEVAAGEHTGGSEGRMARIMDYICLNYRNPISLKNVADELYLSPTYLSKYIRKESGEGFIDLINSVRLSHALEDLMYTDNSIMKIALDNGFASVAAFDKAFKEGYEETPSKYRKQRKKPEEHDSRNLEKVALYLHEHLGDTGSSKDRHEQYLTLSGKGHPPMSLTQLLNVGRASNLLGAATQKQILYCQKNLHIRYVRFWNVFESDMHLDRASRAGRPNFGLLDEVLDFLVDHGLRPYIELRSKPIKILETANLLRRTWESDGECTSQEERAELFNGFFGHIVRRYGRGEISDWIFDYPIPSDVRFEGGKLTFTPINDRLWEAYLNEFDQVASCLKKRVPEAEIGGACFPVQHYGSEGLKKLFDLWKQHRHKPSFVSFTSFPYQIMQENGVWYERKRTDFNFVVDAVSAVKDAVDASGIGNVALHLSECNLTLSDRSYINDTLMRAAFIASSAIETYGTVAFLGIWNMGDAYSDFSDTSSYLFGGSGILTKSGIAKPACHALGFMGRLYQNSAFAERGCLVTCNEHGHYKLLVHHLVNMNTAFYMKEENQLSALGIEQMVETDAHKLIHLKIEHLEDGCWQIRRYCLNMSNGSILNEWLHLDMSIELGPQELDYLERICVPRLFIQKQDTHGGILEFDVELGPNEVQYLHITELN